MNLPPKVQKTLQHKLTLIAIGIISFCIPTMALANPSLNNVAAGQATVTQTQTTTTVNQTSQKVILNWNSFNIGSGEHTHFQQPNGGVALNRINPTQGASEIYGRLTATGQIILVNPAGIYFGPNAYVNVGSLIASTANISNEDFLNGYYRFSNDPNFNGSIHNQGHIIAADNGLIALIGGAVNNEGMISANMGYVTLASGNEFTMSLAGNELVAFTVDEGVTGRAVDYLGNEIEDGIQNTGDILAHGGQVLVTAKAASGVLDHVINLEGRTEVVSAHTKNGELILAGDTESGVVRVAGEIDASGKQAGQTGGKVEITGHNILIDNTADIDASGDAGGGKVNIGGNYLGQGPLPNANAVVMREDAKVNASAFSIGEGGEVIVWSDNYTNVSGEIEAKGGNEGGDGGFVETSGKKVLSIGNVSIDVSANNGTTGTWLLDPTDIYIADNQGNATAAGMIGTDSSANTGSGGNPDIFAASGAVDDSFLSTGNLETALSTANVTVRTTNASGTGNGDITVVDGINWTSTNTLLLQADNNIFINAGISGINGSLNLSAGNTAQSITTGAGGTVDVNNFDILAGHWYQNTATLPDFNVRGSFTINGGADVNITTDPVSFTRAVGGDGSTGDPYELTDIYGVQGMGSSHANLLASYELVNDIDATSTQNWVRAKGQGFKPIGDTSAGYNSGTFNFDSEFAGNFEGNGYVIDGLYINAYDNAVAFIGLSWGNSSQFIQNVGLTNVDFTGANSGSNINLNVGGLIGSWSSSGPVTNVFVTGKLHKGGPGNNGSMGAIAASTSGNSSIISNVYATVDFTQDAVNFDRIGGLVGFLQNSSTLENSYFTGSINPETSSVVRGGLVGRMTNSSEIRDSYASGAISAGTNAGAVIGQFNGGIVSDVFYDSDTSGQTVAAGSGSPTGITAGCFTGSGCTAGTANLSDITTYSGATWSIADGTTGSTWVIFDGQTRPMLSMEYNTTIRTPHQLQLVNTDLTATYTLANNIDLGPAMANAGEVWGTNSGTSTGVGWIPLGNGSGGFSGTFNGSDNRVENLYIDNNGSYFGLFGLIEQTGSINNLGVTDVNISQGTGFYIAAMAGYNRGDITDSWTTGSITSDSFGDGTNDIYLGGFVGFNDGINSSTRATISNSYSDVNVTATSTTAVTAAYVGGFVGAARNSTINRAYATGYTDGVFVTGGFVGLNWNDSTITDAYATGGADSINLGGGFVGSNNAASSIITNAYATGGVNVSGTHGGFAASNSGALNNAYWDQTEFPTSNGGTGLTSTQMQQQASFTGFDFGTVWNIEENLSTPFMRVFYNKAPGKFIAGSTAAADGSTVQINGNGSSLGSLEVSGGGFSIETARNLISNDGIDINTGTRALIYLDGAAFDSNIILVTPADTINTLNLAANTVTIAGTQATSNADVATALGGLSSDSDIIFSMSGNDLSVDNNVNFSVTTTGDYTLDGNITASGSGNVVIDSDTTLGVDAAINAGSGSLQLNGATNGGQTLALTSSGSVVIGDELGGSTALTSLSVNGGGTLTINGAGITTTGAQTYDNAITVGATTALNSTGNGTISFNSTIDGANALTVNSPDGIINFTSTVGGTTPLASLTTDPTVINIGADITTSGDQDYGSDNLQLTNNVVLTSTTGNINSSGYIDGDDGSGPYFFIVSVAGATSEFSGEIRELSNFGKLGAGTLTLSGVNTYTSDTTISAGTLSVAASNNLGNTSNGINLSGGTLLLSAAFDTSRNVSLTNSSNIDVSSGTANFSGAFSGTGTLRKAGAGTLVLSSANTYTGLTYVDAGILRAADDAALGTGSSTVIAGGVLELDNVDVSSDDLIFSSTGGGSVAAIGTSSWSGNVSNTDNAVVISGSGDLTISGVIDDTTSTQGLTHNSSGTTTLTGNNTYDGITDIDAGTLQVGAGGATGTLGTGNVTNDSALVINLTSNYQLDSVLSGTGSLTKNGSGAFTVNETATHSGGTTINAGILEINNATDSIGSGTINVNGGELDGETGSGVLTLNNDFVLGDTSAITLGGTASLRIHGTVSIPNEIDLTANNLWFHGDLSGAGLINVTGSTIYFFGDNSSHSGGITATGGINIIAASTTNPYGTGTVTLQDSARFSAFSVPSVTLANNFVLDGASARTSGSIDMTLNGIISGTQSLWHNSAFDLTVTNASNTYQGNTIMNNAGGKLIFTNAGALGNTDLINVANGELELQSIDAGTTPIQITNGTLITTGTSAIGGDITLISTNPTISNTGTLTISGNFVGDNTTGFSKDGAGTLVVTSSSPSFEGDVSLGDGITRLSGNNSLGTGDLTLDGGTLEVGTNGITIGNSIDISSTSSLGGTLDFTLSGVISGTGDFTKIGSNTITLNNDANSYSGTTTVNDGTLNFTSIANINGGNSALGSTTSSASTIFVGGSGILRYTGSGHSSDRVIELSGAGASIDASGTGSLGISSNIVGNSNALTLTGSGDGEVSGVIDTSVASVTKEGAGTWTLSGSNSYTGQTSINNGTLIANTLANGGLNSSLGAAVASTPIIIGSATPATLVFSGTSSASTNRLITIGAGGGTIQTTSPSAMTLTFTDTITNNSSLTFDLAASNTVRTNKFGAGVYGISGTGNVIKNGDGLLQYGSGGSPFSGQTNYSGSTTVNGGTLRITHTESLSNSSAIVVNSGASLDYFLSGTLVNTNPFQISGDGFNGAGALSVSFSTPTITNPITLMADASIGGSGAFTHAAAITENVAGLSLTKVGSGNLFKSGSSSFTGAFNIDAGRVYATSSGSFGSGATQPSQINVADGTTFNYQTAITNTSPIRITGNGIDGNGAIQSNAPGQITVNNQIVLMADAGIGGRMTIETPITENAVGLNLSKVQVTSLPLIFNASNTYTGETRIQQGYISVQNVNGLGATSGVIVADGASLDFDFGTATLTNTAPITLNGTGYIAGSLRYNGSAGVTTTLNNNIILGSNATIGFGSGSGAANLQLNGDISDGGNGYTLTKDGIAGVILTGTNTYSGGTTISSGFMTVGNGSTSGTLGTGNIVNNASLTFNRSDAYTVSDVISGTGSVTQSGSGTLTFTADNTYSGNTTISSGTLQVGNGGTTGSTGSGSIVNNSNIVFDRSDDFTFPNAISGTGLLTKNNTNTLTLNNSKSYSGGTTINAGILQVTHTNGVGTTGAILVNDGATFEVDLGGGTLANSSTLTLNGSGVGGVGAFYASAPESDTFTNPIVLGSNSTLQLNGSGATRSNLNGTINLNSFDLSLIGFGGNMGGVISGTGSLINGTATGSSWMSAANTYTGGTVLNSGGFFIGSGANLGPGALTFNGGRLSLYFPVDTTISNAVVLNTNAQIDVSFAANDTINFTGGTTGTGALTVRNNASSNLTLNFDTTAINHSGAITFQDIGAGPGSGTVNFNSNIGSNVTNITTSGGDLALVLAGTNTFTGDIIISDGIVRAGSANGIPTTANVSLGNVADTVFDLNGFDVTIASLAGGGATGGNVTLGANTLTTGDANNTTYSGIISGTGSLIKQGTGTLTLAGVNTYTGATTINAGTLANGVADAVSTGSSLTVNASGTYDLGGFSQSLNGINSVSGSTITSSSGTPTLTFDSSSNSTLAGTLTGTLQLTKDGTGTLILAADNTYSGGTSIVDGTLQVGNGGTTGTFGTGTVVNNAALTFNLSNSNVISSDISGTGSLNQAGSGTVIFTGSNTYTGGTTISSGTLQLGNGGSVGSILGNVTNNGVFVFNRSDALTFSGVISGSGDVSHAGTSTLIFTGANSYTGTTSIASGTLQIGSGGTSGSLGTGNVSNSGILSFNRSDALSVNNNISGTGSLVKDNANTLTLSGTSSYSGGTEINNGIVNASSNSALGSGLATVDTGASLQIQDGFSIANDVSIAGVGESGTSGAIEAAGAGTLTGDVTLAANATIGAGTGNTLSISGDIDGTGDGTETLSIAGAGAVTLSGNIGTAAGQTLSSFSASSQTTFTLSGATLSTSGNQTYNNGILLVGNNSISSSNNGTINIPLFAGTSLGGTGSITINTGGTFTERGSFYNDGFIDITADTINIGAGSGAFVTDTDGSQTYTANTIITAAGVQSLTSSAGDITFNGPWNSAGNGITITANNLILNDNVGGSTPGFTGFGSLTVNGDTQVGSSVNVLNVGGFGGTGSGPTFNGDLTFGSTDLTISGRSISLQGTVTATANDASLALVTNDFNQGKTIAGNITLPGAGSSITTSSTAGGSAVNINPAVTTITAGTQNYTENNFSFSSDLTLNSSVGSTDVTIENNINATSAPAFTVSGNLTTGAASSRTYSSVDVTGNLTIGGNLGITTNAGDINVGGNINDDGNGPFTLTFNAGANDVTLDGLIGNTDPVSSMVVTGANININNSSITSNGNQTYNGTVNLGHAGDITLTSSTGNISLDAVAGNGNGLIVNFAGASGTVSGIISNLNSFIKNGNGALVLSGINTYTGDTTINGGSVVVSADSGLGNGGDLILNGGSLRNTSAFSTLRDITLNASGGTFDTAADLTITGVVSGSGSLTKSSANILTLAANNTYTGGSVISAGTLQIGNGGATGSIDGAITNNGALIFNSSADSILSNAITGSGTIEKDGTSTLTIGGTNNYSGTLTITNGTVIATSNSALGSTAAGTIIDTNGTLQLSDVAIGSESITNNGGTISSSGTSTLSGNITLGADSTFDIQSGSFTLNGSVDDGASSFKLTKAGAGELRLPGAHLHDGGIDLDAGILAVGANGSLGNGSLTVNGGAISVTTADIDLSRNFILNADLGIAGNNNFTISGNITGVGRTVNKAGNSVITLSGNNTFDSGLNITAGTIIADSNTALGVGTTSVSNSATLQVANGRTITNTISLNGTGAGGNGALVGAGTAAVNGNINLNTDAMIGTSSAADVLTLGGNVNGAMALTLSGPGTISMTGNVGNATAPTAITANSDLMVDGNITSNGHQTYNNPVALMGTSTFTVSGNSTQNINFNDTITGGQDLNLMGTGAGTYHFALNSGITQNNITVDGGGASTNNALTVANGSDQTFMLTGANTGDINGNTGVTGNFNFNNINNLTGGTGVDNFTLDGGTISGLVDGAGGTNGLTADNVTNTWNITSNNGGNVTGVGSFVNIQNLMGGTDVDTFNLNPGFTIAGLIDGGDVVNLNNIRFDAYTTRLDLFLSLPTGNVFDAGNVYAAGNVLVAGFNRVQQSDGNGIGVITLPDKQNITVTYYDATLLNGEIGDPFYFYGWSVGNPPTPVTETNQPNSDIAAINNQPDINEQNNDGNSAAQINAAVSGNPITTNVLNTTKITPINDGNSVQTGAACYTTGN